jgi:histidine triad (HIT) family protein
MSLDGAYEHDNIFARILRGELPCAKVFEDAHVFAFMDVFPQSRGHVLVIPKDAHARNLLDVEPQTLEKLILGVQRVARAARAALKPEGLTVIQYNGTEAGQTVFHLHFHIIPRYAGVALGRHGETGMADAGELAELAKAIAAEIA